MTEYICTCDAMCVEQKREPQSATNLWGEMRRLAGSISGFVVEVYRGVHETPPTFSNGGTRVLIRPDRIDLV